MRRILIHFAHYSLGSHFPERLCIHRELSGENSTIVRLAYTLDDIPGNEIGGDEDLRASIVDAVYDE